MDYYLDQDKKKTKKNDYTVTSGAGAFLRRVS